MDEGIGAGEGSQKGWPGIRLCSLVAQKRTRCCCRLGLLVAPSEYPLCRELDDARISYRAADLTESSARSASRSLTQVAARIAKMWCIEHVKELETQLEFAGFRKAEILEEGEISIDKSRSANQIPPR